LKKRFVHLTNYSVNKKADAYKKNDKTDLESAPNKGKDTTNGAAKQDNGD